MPLIKAGKNFGSRQIGENAMRTYLSSISALNGS